MTAESASAVIEKKMMAFVRDYNNIPLHTNGEYAKNGFAAISIDGYNQNGKLVLKDIAEAIVKCRIE